MKTIVIVENEVVELKALVSLFQQWQQEVNILTASEEKAAIHLMHQQQVDLLVCNLHPGNRSSLDGFTLLTHTFPYVPCIAISSATGEVERQEVLRNGASHCLARPVDVSILLQHANELLENSAIGSVRGIPIHSLLQMLESEEKTCSLVVSRGGDTGRLYIKDGSLIGAETRNFTGEEAAHLILGWEESIIRIQFFNGQRKRQIDKPLISTILEAFRLKSEREEALKDSQSVLRHQLPLKHLPTLGKRLPLEIGSRLKLEFPRNGILQESTMIGMLQDHYLIVTNPNPQGDIEEMAGGQQRVIFKYLHMGRVWMFKAQLLRSLDNPFKLLFFEYPGVIHFHELREAKRTAIYIPCTFHLDSAEDHYGVLIDLSITGGLCQLKARKDVAPPHLDCGDKVTLRCLLPGVREEQQVQGVIRNLAVSEQTTRVGVEFSPLPSHLRDIIGQYLYHVEASAA